MSYSKSLPTSNMGGLLILLHCTMGNGRAVHSNSNDPAASWGFLHHHGMAAMAWLAPSTLYLRIGMGSQAEARCEGASLPRSELPR